MTDADRRDFWRIFTNHAQDNLLGYVIHFNFEFSNAAKLSVLLSGVSVICFLDGLREHARERAGRRPE